MVSKNPCDDDVYKMDSNPRGFCVIFNFLNFDNKECESRNDSIESVSKVRNTFEGLQFDVRIHQDFSNKQFFSKLNDLINSDDCKSHDSFILYIHSHGLKNGFLTSNNIIISYNEVIKMFSNRKCKNFTKKPKIILFDCCREGMSLEGL